MYEPTGEKFCWSFVIECNLIWAGANKLVWLMGCQSFIAVLCENLLIISSHHNNNNNDIFNNLEDKGNPSNVHYAVSTSLLAVAIAQIPLWLSF